MGSDMMRCVLLGEDLGNLLELLDSAPRMVFCSAFSPPKKVVSWSSARAYRAQRRHAAELLAP